ncbi:hypothetical protein [Cellulomonas marina]|uniref:Uncharacterized protein n=1 Tax=Cellulomonas marina TaxID=988821 RepID=A0A1I0WW99_9CELL|nr:hypothetical protein [Cellulomonas marina]GIG30344.1 hypothetical protein Cma02nite_29440 [Cellulomonas marina]SFA92193.1 hypothetical protein SAMN05421867_103240 [Cellulomonas marina]
MPVRPLLLAAVVAVVFLVALRVLSGVVAWQDVPVALVFGALFAAVDQLRRRMADKERRLRERGGR